jgi:hypothetical protein
MAFAMQDNTKDDAIEYLGKLIWELEYDFIKEWAMASHYSDFVKIKEYPDFKAILINNPL